MKKLIILAATFLLSAPCILGFKLPSLPTKEAVTQLAQAHPVTSITFLTSMVAGAFGKRTSYVPIVGKTGTCPMLAYSPTKRIIGLVVALGATAFIENKGYVKTSVGFGALTFFGTMIHSAGLRANK